MIIGDIKNAEYINNWSQVPDGTRVIEDTYNELYELRWINGIPVLHHIGWRYCQEKHRAKLEEKPLDPPREIDFDPDCMYDQPWLMEMNDD